MLVWFVHFRRAVWRAFQHDALATAKAAAYSSILTVFPALLVLASVVAISHETLKFTREISYAIGQVLPPGTNALALTYFNTSKIRPIRVIVSASLVMLTAMSGVMVSWMAGFRRAYGIQENPWGFWKERAMAFLLIPLSVIPLGFATVLVGFGNQLQNWLAAHTIYELRGAVLLLWTWGRWSIGALTSVAVIAVIYHMAIPRTQSWRRVLPGAVLATVLWFVATVGFGWYVTNYANYAVIYGSLAAVIALLVWLYLVSIVVLVGAEFNALIFPKAEMWSDPKNSRG
ncbi:MAG: YihY/virulence factor BrkB family protein [Acidobacteria bacterium]|nr:YihY/virulence factor BrkB family protein [Acidobacteriota bacterium]MBV9437002.1 YihY/virulence factor BrkB family protein [Acidobacteriota bacterium]